MVVYILVGTRPNFIKITQFKKLSQTVYKSMKISIIHTGQHYDERMANVFFRQFDLFPDHYLNISPGSPNKQIGEIMAKLEDLCNEIGKPDILIVPGDVNSTLAGGLFANKTGIRLAHIEAGLRSFDRTMPEEFNRIIVDELSDVHFVTEPSGVKNLMNENRHADQIHLVGNTMIDTIVAFEKEIEESPVLEEFDLIPEKFVLLTMHRPATVDNEKELEKLVTLIESISEDYKVVFPIHPRTIKNAKEFGLFDRISKNEHLICTEPLDYFSFQKLIKYCSFILTDSGGIQEESTYRRKPCLTLRPNTERPITTDIGTNTLLPFDIPTIKSYVREIENDTYKKGEIPEFWDGGATSRIMSTLSDIIK